jgi:hypothetical protein
VTNSGTVVTDTDPDPDNIAEPPTVNAPTTLTVHPGTTINMKINVSPVDKDDTVSIRITGVPKYETITAGPGETVTRQGSTYTITSKTPGASIADLTLASSYKGKGSVVNTFTVTASNTTSGETATSVVHTVSVTDPPVLATNENTQGVANSLMDISPSFSLAATQEASDQQLLGGAPSNNGSPGLAHTVALLNHYVAAVPVERGTPITNAHSRPVANDQQFLANPHHG